MTDQAEQQVIMNIKPTNKQYLQHKNSKTLSLN